MVGGCDAMLESPSRDPAEAIACQMVPTSRQIAAELRAALAAARRGDQAAMSTAARRAQALGSQILLATASLGPLASPDPLIVTLKTIGLFGNQGGSFFGDELPDPEGLASFEAGLPTLDRHLAQVQAGLPDC
jgi:hypothetical protein